MDQRTEAAIEARIEEMLAGLPPITDEQRRQAVNLLAMPARAAKPAAQAPAASVSKAQRVKSDYAPTAKPAPVRVTQAPVRQIPGFIYVIAFSTGVIKVGRTLDLDKRLGQHDVECARHGVRIVERWTSPAHPAWEANERALVAFCSSTAGERQGKSEYFTGIDFHMVKEFAMGLISPAGTSSI